MDSGTIFILAVVGMLALAVVFLLATARRRDAERAMEVEAAERDAALVGAPTETTSAPATVRATGKEIERSVALERRSAPPAPTAPVPPPAIPDEEALGVTRRQVLNRGIVAGMLLGVSGFSGAMIAFLWPSLSGGFGGKIRLGSADEITSQIQETKEPVYYAAGRFYINPFPKESVTAARSIEAYGAVLDGYEAGFVALYQKCVHLGCRVPWCKTSQWFECPCHGSQYNRVGEKKGGPAPRGLDRFAVTVDRGTVVVDTGLIIPGPPIGTNTTGQESEGPHCVGGAA